MLGSLLALLALQNLTFRLSSIIHTRLKERFGRVFDVNLLKFRTFLMFCSALTSSTVLLQNQFVRGVGFVFFSNIILAFANRTN